MGDMKNNENAALKGPHNVFGGAAGSRSSGATKACGLSLCRPFRAWRNGLAWNPQGDAWANMFGPLGAKMRTSELA